MKRTAAVILSLLAIAALAAFTPTRGPLCGQGYRKTETCAPAFRVSLAAAGTTVWVRWTITSVKADSQTVDVTGPTGVHRKYTALTKTDSVAYGKPPIGATIGGAVVGTAWLNGKSASAVPVTWSYTEPDTLPPSAPTVKVEVFPTSWTLSAGQKQTFCAVYTRSDGTKVLAGNSVLPYCTQFAQS